mmetsp:Transcript_86211/g.266959  ORF Transcript_86211/g.266959 Transcript_86211/m.266959 type:complete len:222 (-) Transcript_86211:288-953(-)
MHCQFPHSWPSKRCRCLRSSSRRSFSDSAPTSTWPQTSCSTSRFFESPSSAPISTTPFPPSSISSSLLQTVAPVSFSSMTSLRVVFRHSQRSFCRMAASNSLSSASIWPSAWATASLAPAAPSLRSCSTLLHISPKRKLCTVSSACSSSGLQQMTTEVRDSPLKAGCNSIVNLESKKGARGKLRRPSLRHCWRSLSAWMQRFRVRRPLLMWFVSVMRSRQL